MSLNLDDAVNPFSNKVEKDLVEEERKIITFDLYGALLNYRLIPHFVGQIARENGLPPALAENLFQIYQSRLMYSGHYKVYSEVLAQTMLYLDMELNSKAFTAAINELYIIHYDLKPHPDVLPALRELQAQGYELYVLCNSSITLCRGMVNKFEGIFKDKHFIFSDSLKSYKPNREFFKGVYDKLKLFGTEHYHVASNYFTDIQGALESRWNVIYVNRYKTGIHPEYPPTGVIDDLTEIPACIANINHKDIEDKKRVEAQKEAVANGSLIPENITAPVQAQNNPVAKVLKVTKEAVSAVTHLVTKEDHPVNNFVPQTEEDKELAQKLTKMAPTRARAVLKARERAMALAKAKKAITGI